MKIASTRFEWWINALIKHCVRNIFLLYLPQKAGPLKSTLIEYKEHVLCFTQGMSAPTELPTTTQISVNNSFWDHCCITITSYKVMGNVVSRTYISFCHNIFLCSKVLCICTIALENVNIIIITSIIETDTLSYKRR